MADGGCLGTVPFGDLGLGVQTRLAGEVSEEEGLASDHLMGWAGGPAESRWEEGLSAASRCREEPVAGRACCSFSGYSRIPGSDKDQFPGSIDCRLVRESMCFGGDWPLSRPEQKLAL